MMKDVNLYSQVEKTKNTNVEKYQDLVFYARRKHNVETELVSFVVDAVGAEKLACKRNRGSGDGGSSTRNKKLDTQFTNSLN